ncbi:L,D-transpeptidase ErfK/SrfK [Nitrosomonas cryotolerans]|uniref:L,D-transpeptidase ErfK/SrfK n=1 Tax=Nitrosomonas cryotolerans ATCC 49181 TaxID=1131553 RepID=A0A1N6J237_9PROT|nr:L,D-transpeptidase family protein [Nitrosomonas cryotolerans]SFP53420.1 L,D-transpeptidase ErfK/SrfK [Nitrosomonas cryotolerans]SIO38313.1 L,D-transpeptidase ErfK/SrfK [Nitrosomonas cryotolerans ATCC 49181]
MHGIIIFFVVLFSITTIDSTQAETWTLPPADIDIFGQIRTVAASSEDTLLDIARRHGIGQIEILLANPKVDRWLPVNGAEVILPNRYIIPQAKRKGLVLNLPEMRLYYFPELKKGEKPLIVTHPVSIGRMDWNTPLGITKIVEKKKNPTWTPPQSLRDEAIARGDPPLPAFVPAGPDNPLGQYAMRLGTTSGSYLIHGTNKPFGVGMRVTHGCVRMYPEDIETLFTQVPVGTQIQLVNQPIKLGWLASSLFIELHPPLEEDQDQFVDYTQKVMDAINDFLIQESTDYRSHLPIHVEIDSQILKQAIAEKSGLPILISK